MTCVLRYESGVENDLLEATAYYVAAKAGRQPHDFFALIAEAFAPILRHPELADVYSLPIPTRADYRRVNVWRFAFLYRVDDEAQEVIIERIYHERSARL